jgi:hypothetical protein
VICDGRVLDLTNSKIGVFLCCYNLCHRYGHHLWWLNLYFHYWLHHSLWHRRCRWRHCHRSHHSRCIRNWSHHCRRIYRYRRWFLQQGFWRRSKLDLIWRRCQADYGWPDGCCWSCCARPVNSGPDQPLAIDFRIQ